MEQISYASRYTRSRKQRSFCATATYTVALRNVRNALALGDLSCARDTENKQQWMTGEAPSATARFYSNGRNSYSSLVPCARRPSKMASYSSFSCLDSCSDQRLCFRSLLFQNFRTNFWNRLVLLVRFVENFTRQLTKLLVWINLHRGYPTITQLVFWSSADRDSTTPPCLFFFQEECWK